MAAFYFEQGVDGDRGSGFLNGDAVYEDFTGKDDGLGFCWDSARPRSRRSVSRRLRSDLGFMMGLRISHPTKLRFCL